MFLLLISCGSRVQITEHIKNAYEELTLSNWVLEKTLESPLDSKEIKPVNLKEINPEYSLMLKLKLQYFGQLIRRADSLEETLMLGKIEGGRKRGDHRG